MKNYENELPSDYAEIYSLDAKSAKVGILLNVFALILTVIAVVVGGAILSVNNALIVSTTNLLECLIWLLVLCVMLFAYIVLHELVHGLAYYIMTKQKLTFGITLTVAYCGVPNIYVYKKTALFAVLAPFVLFSVLFLVLAFCVPSVIGKWIFMLMFAIHFGGCVGDLFDAFLLIFKFKGNVLMNDSGPKQIFYSNVPQKNK